MDNTRLPKLVYNYLREQSTLWAKDTKEIFNQIKCLDLFDNNVPIINFKEFLNHAKKTLLSHYEISWRLLATKKTKLGIYNEYKNDYHVEKYCQIHLKRFQRSLLARLRLGVLPIQVEVGRYSNIPRQDRHCPLCTSREIEDENHILFQCPKYEAPRTKLLDSVTEKVNNFILLDEASKIGILTSHINVIRKTANYIKSVLEIRQNQLPL